jgi:adenine phosphoribosyltransferase
MDLKSMITSIPDFPKVGVLFRDVSPALKDPKALDYIAYKMVEMVDLQAIDCFAGIESRGFTLAMLLASTHKKGFLQIRKAGKTPPPFVQQSYALEYGQATIEMAPGQGRIMIVDDVLATGGTLQAAADIAARAGYDVQELGVLINLTFLNQMKFKGRDVHSVLQY